MQFLLAVTYAAPVLRKQKSDACCHMAKTLPEEKLCKTAGGVILLVIHFSMYDTFL